MFNQIMTFEIKLDSWKRQLLENNLYHFFTYQEIKQIYENVIFERDIYVGILESLK
jgi:ribonucleotide reductase beta subunit family protein with ferritin-like domain